MLNISPLVATIFKSFSGNETSNWETGLPSIILDFRAGLPKVWVTKTIFPCSCCVQRVVVVVAQSDSVTRFCKLLTTVAILSGGTLPQVPQWHDASGHIVLKKSSVSYRFEMALKHYCPTCCVPYVDTRLDCWLPTPSDTALFSSQHFGNTQGAVTTGFAAGWELQPDDCDLYNNSALTRFLSLEPCHNVKV